MNNISNPNDRDRDRDLNQKVDHLKSLTNAAGLPLLDLERVETFKINLIPNKNVGPAKFKPIADKPGQYFAHPVTIRALKKDIFEASEGFIDLEIPYTCYSCHLALDLQFWHFCPQCEKSFP